MRAYIVRRLLISIPLVFLMTFVIFAVINLNPQSSLDKYMMNPNISFQAIEQEKERTGFYDSLPVRYAKWLSGVLFDVRLGRDRRPLVSFAAPKQFPEQFMVDTSQTVGADVETLSAETPSIDLMAREPLARRIEAVMPAIVSYRLEVEHIPPESSADEKDKGQPAADSADAADGAEPSADDGKPAGPAPSQLTVTLIPLGDKEPVTVTSRIPPGASKEVVLGATTLNEAGLLGHPVEGLVLSFEGPGALAIREVSTVLDLYEIQKPARRRPYLVIRYPDAETSVVLTDPGTPYEAHRLRGHDWMPEGKVTDIDAEGKQIKADFSFRSLRIEVGNPGDEPAQYHLVIESGEPGSLQATRLPFELGPGERASREFLFADMNEMGVDLTNVRSIGVAATKPSMLYVYRIELEEDMRMVSIGWIPDFGRTHKNIPVLETLMGRVKNTVLLVIAAILLTWLVALPAGVVAAVRQYHLSDKVLSFVSFIGMSMPSFFLAVLVRYLLQQGSDPESLLAFLPNLPDSGRTSITYESMSALGKFGDLLKHAVAPVLVLAMGGMAGLQRVMRGTMLETQRQQFITTARAKGLSERVVIFKHALRNAITPFVAGFGSILPRLIGGSLFVEIIFNYPGVGRLMYNAVLERDVNLVMANTLIAALLLVLGNLIADILLAIVDPRVSYA